MLNDCLGNEPREPPVLHQIGQQKCVLSSERDWIEHSRVDIRMSASHGESSRIQVLNAAVGLKHVLLKSDEPQFFCSSHQIGAIPHETELKAIVLGRARDG